MDSFPTGTAGPTHSTEWNPSPSSPTDSLHGVDPSPDSKGANTPSLDTILYLAIVFNADPAEWVREIAQQFYAEIDARLAARGE